MTICPCCEEVTSFETIWEDEIVPIRDEQIEVRIKYQKCLACGEKSIDLHDEYDHLAEAYETYRRRKGMIQPEEIRSFRKRYGLTQGELSRLLGWGKTTLSRYENGALQDETHDTAFRLAMEPSALLRLIEEKTDALNPGRKGDLVDLLKNEERQLYSYSWFLEAQMGSYEPSEMSGYRALSLEKVVNAILYFCDEGAFKTKLNKLLFYLDFKHFKEERVSVTGLRYAHLPYGPVPNDFEAYFSYMEHYRMFDVEEVVFGNNESAEKFHTAVEPRLALFSASELKTLIEVREMFKGYTSRKIKELSHREAGYKATETGDLISYSHADDLQICKYRNASVGRKKEEVMQKKRGYSRYELRDNRKLVYVGITDDPARRESEHKNDGKRFTSMNVVGPKVTKGSAEQWEEERLATYGKNHKGRTPRHNKTER